MQDHARANMRCVDWWMELDFHWKFGVRLEANAAAEGSVGAEKSKLDLLTFQRAQLFVVFTTLPMPPRERR